MSLIIPAIIPTSRTHLFEMVESLRPFVSEVQVDVMDGVFVPDTSWPYGEGDASGQVQDIGDITSMVDIEVDLMISNPESYIDEWVAAGAKRIVVHIESTERMDKIVAHRAIHSYELGISLNNTTAISAVVPYLQSVDFVQCMGIETIGSQGAVFDSSVLDTIRTLREMYPDISISVDGSVNMDTILLLRDTGANRFVVGSAILTAPNPQLAYEALRALIA